MKNKNIYNIIITIIAIVLLAIVIFLIINNRKSLITEEEALDIALRNVNTTRENITITSTNKDHSDNKYKFEFFDNNYEYDIEIDMTSGRVIKIEKDVRKGVNIENDTSDNQITLEEAKEVALSYLNLDNSEVTFTKNKLDLENGILIYELELFTTDMEYEIDINAYNKEIIRVEKDNKNNYNIDNNSNNYIGSDKAKDIALNHSGISDNVIWKRTEFDFENNIPIYEVEFYCNNMEYNYEINAINGNIIKYEIDRDY